MKMKIGTETERAAIRVKTNHANNNQKSDRHDEAALVIFNKSSMYVMDLTPFGCNFPYLPKTVLLLSYVRLLFVLKDPKEFAGLPKEFAAFPEGFAGLPEEFVGFPVGFAGFPKEFVGFPSGFAAFPREFAGFPNGIAGFPKELAGLPREFAATAQQPPEDIKELRDKANPR